MIESSGDGWLRRALAVVVAQMEGRRERARTNDKRTRNQRHDCSGGINDVHVIHSYHSA